MLFIFYLNSRKLNGKKMRGNANSSSESNRCKQNTVINNIKMIGGEK
jgi:hypothetical protein